MIPHLLDIQAEPTRHGGGEKRQTMHVGHQTRDEDAPIAHCTAWGLARNLERRLRSGPVREHAGAGEVAATNLAWARKVGLVDEKGAGELAAIRCGSFAAHTYSRAPRELVQLGADLIAWLYLFDDRVGEGHEVGSVAALRHRFGSYEHVLRWHELPRDPQPLHVGLLDLIERASRLGATPEWQARFTTSMTRYFDGCALELPYRQRGEPPGVIDYTYIRSLSVGAYPVFDLIELGSGLFLTDHEAQRLRPARYLASLLCAWVNDIYSFPKEREDGEPLNIVAAIVHERGLSPADALQAAIDRYNADFARFDDFIMDACEQLPGPAVRDKLTGLLDWVHGNRAWTQLCGRYR